MCQSATERWPYESYTAFFPSGRRTYSGFESSFITVCHINDEYQCTLTPIEKRLTISSAGCSSESMALANGYVHSAHCGSKSHSIEEHSPQKLRSECTVEAFGVSRFMTALYFLHKDHKNMKGGLEM